MSLQIHNIKFPQVYLWTFWCANKRSPFLQKRIFGFFFFSKSCLKVGGAAYTRVRLIHEFLRYLIHEATLFCFVASNIWETFPSAFKKLHLSFNHFYKQYQLTSSQLIPNLFVKFNLTVFYSEFCPCFINFYFLLHCIVFVWKVNVSFKIYKRLFQASFFFYFLF